MSAPTITAARSWKALFDVGDPETVTEIFRQALDHRSRASKADREVIDQAIRHIQVPGFRPGKGPADKLALELAAKCYQKAEIRHSVVPVALGLWLSQCAEFRKRLEDALLQQNISIQNCEVSDGWLQDWAWEEFEQLIAGIASVTGDAEGMVRIGICALTGRAPQIRRDAEEREEPTVDFEDWLKALGKLEPSAPQWSGIDKFLENAKRLSEVAAGRRAASPIFDQLQSKAADLLENFDVDITAWNVVKFKTSDLPTVLECILRMITDLHIVQTPAPSTFKERMAAFQEQRNAGDRITEAGVAIGSLLRDEAAVLEEHAGSTIADGASPLPDDGTDRPEQSEHAPKVPITASVDSLEECRIRSAIAKPADIILPQPTGFGTAMALALDCNCDETPSVPDEQVMLERHFDPCISGSTEQPAPMPISAAVNQVEDRDTASEAPVPPKPLDAEEITIAQVIVSIASPEPILLDSETQFTPDGQAPRMKTMSSYVWKLLSEQRFGLSSALARALKRANPQAKPPVPYWLLEALALSQNIAADGGETAARLAKAFAEFDSSLLEGRSGESNLPVRLLLFAASAYPAIIAPRTGAGSILRLLAIPELHDLNSGISDFSDRLQPLDTSALSDMKSKVARGQGLEKLQASAANWMRRSSAGKLSYAPATWVLRKLVETGQPLNELLTPVRDNVATRLSSVQASIDQLATSKQVRKVIQHTDRVLLGRRMGRPILGDSLVQLEESISEAVSIARSWVALQQPRPTSSGSYQIEIADRLRDKLEKAYPAVSEFLQKQAKRYSQSELGWAARCCETAVANIMSLFDADKPLVFQEQDADLILNGELLCVRNISLGDHWAIEPDDPYAQINAIRDYILNPPAGWQESMTLLCANGDHLATDRLLTYIGALDRSVDLEPLQAQREDALREERRTLFRRIADVRRKIDNAVALSHLTEAERLKFMHTVEEVQAQAQYSLALHLDKRLLDEIENTIKTNRDNEVESVRQRLQQVAQDHPERARILQLLQAGDVVTANDYIEMIRNHEALPSEAEEHRDSFREFLPERLQKIEQLLDEKGGGQVCRIVQAGKNFAGVDMSRVVGAQVKQAAEMLQVWHEVKRRQDIDEKSGRVLLDCIGFNVLTVRIDRKGRRVWMDVVTDPVADRDRCPIPFFGSNAHGNYRVLCAWARPTEEDLISDVGDTSHGRATLVLYFGRMSETRRRDLARQSLKQRRSFILLDETLLVFLCGERGSRLPVLFACSLPFTWAEPYTTTAGLLAPEMLYGRQQERASVINPFGSCFIYGGRQLGKTVLLRDVERQVHDPASGRIAFWLDLKAKGIGYDRPVDDLWLILSAEFKEHGVLPSTANVHAAPDKMFEHIERWLAGDNSRRILLLLDESDRFLEIDGSPRESNNGTLGEFSRAAKLKGLMEATNRRFKVVFAGLHNVQRTTQLVNHPLAHFGDAICIGPLLTGSDRRAACDLVERPLAALGYRFESADLVMRLVAQANYYPSLIQLYCSHLLQHVTGKPQAGPPYVLTSRHLEELYDSRELQRAIRDRLLWTLQLDDRYEVLAYIIAWNYMCDREKGIVDGIPVSTIRQNAIGCWPEEFLKIASERAFEVLLEEMVGLGVLRTAAPGRYTLRSPNVLTLMGNLQDIESALTRRREPVTQFEAAAFRAANLSNPVKRSCLTAQQESQLRPRTHSVLAAFGVPAAGLGDIRSSVERLFGADEVIDCSGVLDARGFAGRLQELENRTRDAHTVVLVPTECPWSESWFSEAVRKVEKLTSKTSFVTVLFVGDGRTAWRWAKAGDSVSQQLTQQGVGVLTLEPWKDSMVRQWLDDCGFQSVPEFREKLKTLTGYWSSLLYDLHAKLRSSSGGVHERELVVDKLTTGNQSTNLEAFGLGPNGPTVALKELAIVDAPATPEELAGAAHLDTDLALAAFSWADLMGIVRPVGNDRWELDPIVSQALRNQAV